MVSASNASTLDVMTTRTLPPPGVTPIPAADEDDREGDAVDPKADRTADEEADAAVQREQRDHAGEIADGTDELGRQAPWRCAARSSAGRS